MSAVFVRKTSGSLRCGVPSMRRTSRSEHFATLHATPHLSRPVGSVRPFIATRSTVSVA